MSRSRVIASLPVAALFILVAGAPRRLAQSFGSPWLKSAPVMFNRLLCAALGVEVNRMGAASAPGQRLIVANHVSWLDILVLGAMEPMTFLAKKEIGGPYLGRQIAGLQGVIYVDRQRRRAIPAVNAEMAAAMGAGQSVVLFAEATTSDGVRVLRFRSSHFEAARAALAAGRPAFVQPVYLHFRRLGGLAMSRRDKPAVAWYGDMQFMPHLMGMIASGGVRCDVHYGDAIPVAAFADRKSLARATEGAVRRLAEAAKAAG